MDMEQQKSKMVSKQGGNAYIFLRKLLSVQFPQFCLSNSICDHQQRPFAAIF